MSNETKWTPGPWMVVMERPAGATMYGIIQHTHASVTISAEDYFASSVGKDDDGYLAPTFDDVDEGRIDCSPSRLANAHLIAAAPELYEALENLLSDYKDAMDEWADDALDHAEILEQQARAALAKARGEQ